MTFTQRADKRFLCPKCNSIIIFVHGGGIEYDIEYCSSRTCDYEVIYGTTTDLKND